MLPAEVARGLDVDGNRAGGVLGQSGARGVRRSNPPLGSTSPFSASAGDAHLYRRISHVANIKSQKKRILTNAKAADRNKAVKSELRTRVKTAAKSVGEGNSDEMLRLAVKRLDMAAAKGIIHPNQAARRKSRLMKHINAGA